MAGTAAPVEEECDIAPSENLEVKEVELDSTPGLAQGATSEVNRAEEELKELMDMHTKTVQQREEQMKNERKLQDRVANSCHPLHPGTEELSIHNLNHRFIAEAQVESQEKAAIEAASHSVGISEDVPDVSRGESANKAAEDHAPDPLNLGDAFMLRTQRASVTKENASLREKVSELEMPRTRLAIITGENTTFEENGKVGVKVDTVQRVNDEELELPKQAEEPESVGKELDMQRLQSKIYELPLDIGCEVARCIATECGLHPIINDAGEWNFDLEAAPSDTQEFIFNFVDEKWRMAQGMRASTSSFTTACATCGKPAWSEGPNRQPLCQQCAFPYSSDEDLDAPSHPVISATVADDTEDVTLKYDQNSESRGFGFVTFESVESAPQVVENYNENMFNGKWIDCKPAVPEDEKGKGKGKGGKSAPDPIADADTPVTEKLFVGSLPPTATEDLDEDEERIFWEVFSKDENEAEAVSLLTPSGQRWEPPLPKAVTNMGNMLSQRFHDQETYFDISQPYVGGLPLFNKLIKAHEELSRYARSLVQNAPHGFSIRRQHEELAKVTGYGNYLRAHMFRTLAILTPYLGLHTKIRPHLGPLDWDILLELMASGTGKGAEVSKLHIWSTARTFCSIVDSRLAAAHRPTGFNIITIIVLVIALVIISFISAR